jgi:hypothetical protein
MSVNVQPRALAFEDKYAASSPPGAVAAKDHLWAHEARLPLDFRPSITKMTQTKQVCM